VTARVTSTADIFMITAVMMASSIGIDDVVFVDIHGVSGRGLWLSSWGLPISVPRVGSSATLQRF
jgi:hypothetical protein